MTEDVRVVKTKQNIEKTFLHLLSEHTFHKITVSMIVREAMINKGTFYRHYTDKYDLAYHVAEDTLDRFAELVYVGLDHLTSGTTQKDVMHTLINSFNDVLPSLIALQAIDIPNMDVRRSVVKIISDGIKAYAADRREAASADTEAWVIAQLAIAYPEYVRDMDEPLDLYGYIVAIHEASGLFLPWLSDEDTEAKNIYTTTYGDLCMLPSARPQRDHADGDAAE